MGDDLSVDDRTHAIGKLFIFFVFFGTCVFFLLGLCRHFFNPDVTNLDFTAMSAFTIPAFALVHGFKVFAVGVTLLRILGRCVMTLICQWVTDNQRFFLKLLAERRFHFWLQRDGDAFLAVEHVHRYLVVEVTAYHIVQDVQTFIERSALQCIVCELFDFIVSQVVNEILLRAVGLYGQRLLVCIHKDAVRGQHLLPFLIGEIDI